MNSNGSSTTPPMRDCCPICCSRPGTCGPSPTTPTSWSRFFARLNRRSSLVKPGQLRIRLPQGGFGHLEVLLRVVGLALRVVICLLCRLDVALRGGQRRPEFLVAAAGRVELVVVLVGGDDGVGVGTACLVECARGGVAPVQRL